MPKNEVNLYFSSSTLIQQKLAIMPYFLRFKVTLQN